MTGESPQSRRRSRLASFSLRDVLLVTAIVALCLAWWIDRERPVAKSYDVVGPVYVMYELKTSPNSRITRTVKGASGIDFVGDAIVAYTEEGGTVISPHNLVRLNWILE